MNKNLPMEVTGKMSIGEKIKRFFSVICRNNVTVSRTGEIFHMPILAFLIIALLTFKISVIAIPPYFRVREKYSSPLFSF